VIEPRHPIRVGCVYEITHFGPGARIELFDPSVPGWMGMADGSRTVGHLVPGDTFIAVDRVETLHGETDELWIVLCRGVLGKCLLSEWDLRTVLEVGTPEEP
jgi:hypothetical protein